TFCLASCPGVGVGGHVPVPPCTSLAELARYPCALIDVKAAPADLHLKLRPRCLDVERHGAVVKVPAERAPHPAGTPVGPLGSPADVIELGELDREVFDAEVWVLDDADRMMPRAASHEED